MAALQFRPSVRAKVWPKAFTLIELLVVIGIVVLLLAILLPAVSRVTANSRAIKCLSNIRQIGLAVREYANDNRGKNPLNFDKPPPGKYWCQDDRIGRYLPVPAAGRSQPAVYACPEDDGGRRSYAMNLWASSKIDKPISSSPNGELWADNAPTSRMILIAEAWSGNGSPAGGWEANPTIGFAGDSAAHRFGFGPGIVPPITVGRWGQVNCELPFVRHRQLSHRNLGVLPRGRVTILFGDGHAELLSEADLVTSSGATTGRALWSPLDLRE